MSTSKYSNDRNSTRTTNVCEGCRIRKIKCDSSERGCHHCRDIGIECVRSLLIRFKHGANQKSMRFAPEQIWALPTTTLRYFDETPELVDFYHGNVTRSQAAEEHILPREVHDSTIDSSPSSLPRPTPRLRSQDVALCTPRSAPGSHTIPIPPRAFCDTPSVTRSRDNHSPWTCQSLDSNDVITPHPEVVQPLTEAEALLLRNFIDNMALWADGPDPERSFELRAARMALTDPILKHAICAFSARHVHRHAPNRDAEALEHQDMCLRLLIPAMSGQQSTNEAVMAAVAILRQNEELDECDNRFHLEGTTRMLNDVSTFASSGGLGEATAWLCLREDIYVSLTTQSPIRTNLAPFANATWTRGDDDFSWTNRMVLMLAELLSVAFLVPTDFAALADLRTRITSWHLSKPYSFNPIYSLPRHPAAGRHLPELWTLAPSHAIGLQYYHIAQLVLSVSTNVPGARPFDHILEHRALEKELRHHLLLVVGIANSNPRAQNTWFTAHHCLAVWGGCLRKSGDQQACRSFLMAMEEQVGWRVGNLMRWLSSQWEDDSE